MTLGVGLIFLAVAIILLAVSGVSAYSSSQTVSREQSAPGKVVDLVVRQSQGGVNSEGTRIAPQDYYYPKVEFALPDGTVKTVQLAEGSWPPAYEKGDQVTVRYDPTRPINARIQSSTGDLMMWFVPGITGFLGLIFLVVAALVLRGYQKEVKEAQALATTVS